MSLIFRDVGLDRRKVDDLMTQGIRIVPRENVAAIAALFRLQRNDGVHLIDGHEFVGMPLVTRLAARGSTAGRLRRPWERRRRIARGRLGGVSGVLVQLRSEHLNLLTQRFDLRLEGRNEGATRGVNVVFGFPSLHPLMKHLPETKKLE
jgi:hypothetical protein